MSESIKRAYEQLRELQGSELFAIEEDGDKRSLQTRGVGITWSVWRAIKLVVQDALATDTEQAVEIERLRKERDVLARRLKVGVPYATLGQGVIAILDAHEAEAAKAAGGSDD